MEESEIGLDPATVNPWIRRKLGLPIINLISLSDDQIKDCLEEAADLANYHVNCHGVNEDYAYTWAKNVALSLCKKQVGMNTLPYNNDRLSNNGIKRNLSSYIKLADREMWELNRQIRNERCI